MKDTSLRIGEPMPNFSGLKGVDGKTYGSADFNDTFLVIVFSCNHCPYVQAYEQRMNDFQKSYAEKGVRLIAINSNDTGNYPDDRFEAMVQRARERGFLFPYLRDEHQTVAEAFGATHTPQFFLFDKERVLRYSGKMDDNWKDPGAVKERYLPQSVEALLAGRTVPVAETFSVGCTIKWKA
jgi:thiol-disulfide isomerase/thioredoxin